MLFAKIRDQKLRNILKKKELLKNTQKFARIKFLSEKDIRIPLNKNLAFKHFANTRIVRRCILTNRSRGLTKPYNISRIKLRELLQFGIIPGYKKSVW